MPGEEILDTDVFIQCVPVQTVTESNKLPVRAFSPRGIQQSGIPGQRNGQAAPIIQFYRKRVIGCTDAQHRRDFKFNF